MTSLEQCHAALSRVQGFVAEPLTALQHAEAHRAFWRPRSVRVIVLAESHVYTTAEETTLVVTVPWRARWNAPTGFVRLVYCVGYGEPELVDGPFFDPLGTPQYWKLLFS